MGDENVPHFCYLYILQFAQAWTCTPLFAIGFTLLVFSILQYRKNLKLRKQKMNIILKLTYVSMISSLLIYLLKLILSQVVFWLQFYNNYEQELSERYLIASKYEFVLDCIGIFAMQTTILLVPANWLDNICHLFKEFSKQPNLSEEETQQLNKAIQFQECSIKIVKIYFAIRVVSMVGLMIPFAAINDEQQLSTVADIILIWWQVESLFLLVILVLGMLSVMYNKKLQEILQESDYKLMIRHYAMLITCTVLRLITDLMFTFFYFKYEYSKNDCYATKTKEANAFSIINILLEGLLTLYVSVIVVLRIYNTDGQQIEDPMSFIIDSAARESRQIRVQFVEKDSKPKKETLI